MASSQRASASGPRAAIATESPNAKREDRAARAGMRASDVISEEFEGAFPVHAVAPHQLANNGGLMMALPFFPSSGSPRTNQ